MTRATMDVSAPERSRRWVVPVVVGLVAALAVAVAVALLRGGDAATPATDTASAARADAPSTPGLTVADAPPAPTGDVTEGPAGDARSAVEGFLTAEAARDLEAAFTFLAPEEQQAFGTAARYVAEHADLLGAVTGFEVLEETTDPATGAAVVVARVGFEPQLDTVTGLTPAVATVDFPVVQGEDGWSIQLAETTFTPVLPSDERAAQAAEAVIAAATACEPPPKAYPGALLGRPGLLDELCDASGEPRIAEVTPFDDPLTNQPFTTAYGPDLVLWARAVHVAAPVDLRLVMAPYGDSWTLIGVIPPPI